MKLAIFCAIAAAAAAFPKDMAETDPLKVACEATCGTKEEMIVADEDRTAKIWSDECSECFVAFCTDNTEHKHCGHLHCADQWHACRERDNVDALPSWMSPNCCSWSQCACADSDESWCERFESCDEE